VGLASTVPGFVPQSNLRAGSCSTYAPSCTSAVAAVAARLHDDRQRREVVLGNTCHMPYTGSPPCALFHGKAASGANLQSAGAGMGSIGFGDSA
jgi:hypothetical protein